MLYNCKLKTSKVSLYCKIRKISSRFFHGRVDSFHVRNLSFFFTYTASYFHVCKFGENFTQRIAFSRALLKIFSRTGTHFHGRESIFFHAREPFFHVEKKTLVETLTPKPRPKHTIADRMSSVFFFTTSKTGSLAWKKWISFRENAYLYVKKSSKVPLKNRFFTWNFFQI